MGEGSTRRLQVKVNSQLHYVTPDETRVLTSINASTPLLQVALACVAHKGTISTWDDNPTKGY